MAEVTGVIGNQEVELNNAATEVTLRMLLQSSLASTKEQKENIKNLAQKMGLDPTKVEALHSAIAGTANKSKDAEKKLTLLGVSADGAKKIFEEVQALSGKLMSGEGQLSDFFGSLSKIPGPAGVVAGLFQQVAKFQESNLKAYQAISDSGVSLSGNLTQMRLSASSVYLTLDQFTKIIKDSGEKLSRFGGDADGGTRAFIRISKQLNESQAGDQLRALGYTSEQLNQGLINYISVTGGRTKKELANTESIIQSTQGYLEQLDRLATITGKSREVQEKQHEQAMFEVDVQMTMAKMGEDQRKAFDAAMREAAAFHGQAGRDIVLAAAQGREVTGKAGQMLTAVAPSAAEAIKNLQKTAEVHKAGSAEFKNLSNVAREANINAFSKIPAVVWSVNDSFKLISDSSRTAAKDTMTGIDTANKAAAQETERLKTQEERRKSEADAAAKTQKAVFELGREMMEALMPAVKLLTGWFNTTVRVVRILVDEAKIFVQRLKESPAAITGLIAAFGALAFVVTQRKIEEAKELARQKVAKKLETEQLLSKLGATSTNPLYVWVVNQTGSPTAPTPAPAPPPKGGKMGKVAKGGIAALGGVALGYGAEALRESGSEKTGAALDIASSALQWGGTGAMIGSFIAPGLGTAIGAGVGAALGGGYSLYQNIGAFKKPEVKEVPKPKVEPAVEAMTDEIGNSLENLDDSNNRTNETLEKLSNRLDSLNNITAELSKYMRETAENTKRNVDATRALNRNAFPTP